MYYKPLITLGVWVLGGICVRVMKKNRTRQQDISCVGSVHSISFHCIRVV